MCSPEFYEISYQINPWMDLKNQSDWAKSQKQWKLLHHTIIRLGGFVEYCKPVRGQPDMVFTANAALIHNNKAILSNFLCKERQKEKLHYKEALSEIMEVYELPESIAFEGAGDALFAGNKLFAGHGFRSDINSYSLIKDILNLKEIIYCKLINPNFYHLDTCFCPLNENHALIYKDAFENVEEISNHINLHFVPIDEAKKFACNAVVIGNNVILPNDCVQTMNILNNLGFIAHPLELDQFLKAGGSAKCMTLKLNDLVYSNN